MKKFVFTVLASATLLGAISFTTLANGFDPRFPGPVHQQPERRIEVQRASEQQLQQEARQERIVRRMHERHRY